jgi:glycerol-3-phosphate dehydrogenase
LSTYAGLRPLLATGANTPSQTSREHDIALQPDGMIIVAGGKLTTMRRMGEQVVDRALDVLHAAGLERRLDRCVTAHRRLPGGGPPSTALAASALADDVRAHLAAAYGARAADLLAMMAPSNHLAARIDPELPYVWGEVVFAARHEHARSLVDALVRRVPLFRDARDQGLAAAGDAAALLADELGWTPAERARAVDDYRTTVDRSRLWRAELGAVT